MLHTSHRLSAFALLLFALFLVGCGDDNVTTPTPSPTPTPAPEPTPGTADVVITIAGENGDMSFSPADAAVKVGQTVAWHNNDTQTHTATQDTTGGFDTGDIAAGATSAPIQMTTAGSFPYHCKLHPSMVGKLTVSQ